MTPEQTLWQSVLLRACTDATADDPSSQDDRRAKRDADRWLRGNGRDFRHVCALAGMDSDFVHEAYVGGRIDAELLRASAEGRKQRRGVTA